MKKNVYILYSMLFCSTFAIAHKITQGAQEAKEVVLHAPITFTQHGVNDFFKDTLNATQYRQDILPNNFSHLAQFIEHGLKRRQGRAYTQSIMRLFNNVLKRSM